MKKTDPRTKLFLLIAINVVMMTGKITGIFVPIRIILTLIPLLLMIREKWYRSSLLYFLAYLYVFLLEGYTLQDIPKVPLIILLFTTGLISRFLAGLMMAYYMMKTTTVSEFVTAMERMHIPKVVVIPFAVMFRFFPTIKEEWQDIKNAMKMRGIGLAGRNPLDVLEYVMVPILMSVSRIADELTAASMTKCLSVDGKRSHIACIGFSALDVLLIICAVLGLFAHFFVGGIIGA
ncbi:MAG: energy-coupling factor transporter transmembrane protein EcfT [Lachnospiraceae bacterium]|nr:energy-coupling factor transporter transmembrane protein EcfT [Lachnospiraceae bacterium]